MPHGLIYFPLTALVVTVVLIIVVRRKPKQ
jgi:hypothetical protein